MKKKVLSMAAGFVLFASIAFAGDMLVSSGAQSQAGAASNLSLQQTSTVPEGTGRWFVPPVQPYSPPLFPYLGPFTSGANIIDDLRIFPEVLSRDQATRLYRGGVEVRINPFEKFVFQFDSCKLMHTLPTRYTRVAIITLRAEKTAGTADVIGKAALEAMNMGATGIYLIKKVAISGSQSSGWGIGMGGVAGQLSGQGQTNAITGSVGTGYNTAQAKPVFEETLAVLAIQE